MNPSGEIKSTRGRGRGPWKQLIDQGELRRPYSTPNVTGSVGVADHSISTPDQGAGGDAPRRSNLSAEAKEFFPKGYMTGQFDEGPLEGGDCPPMVPVYNSVSTSIPEQVTLNHLADLIQHLTLNPGRFDALVEPFVEILGHYLNDGATIKAVVNSIVEQSIGESNFRYSGARLCNYLRNAVSLPGSQNYFITCILERCREENEQLNSLMEPNPRRIHGYVLFLAELFMQVELAKGSSDRITILGTDVMALLSRMLTSFSPENVKCVCQVLKLAGLPLDQQECQSMDIVFERLGHIQSFCIEPSIVRIIQNIIQLRQCGWGNNPRSTSVNSTQQIQSVQKNEPVFYGPDGQILTAEESRFLQDNVGTAHEGEEYDEYGEDGEVWMQDDEMDEEFEAAYEEFLQMTKNQTKNT